MKPAAYRMIEMERNAAGAATIQGDTRDGYDGTAGRSMQDILNRRLAIAKQLRIDDLRAQIQRPGAGA